MRWFYRILVYFVRPIICCALIVNGVPPTIRALASAISTVAKALK